MMALKKMGLTAAVAAVMAFGVGINIGATPASALTCPEPASASVERLLGITTDPVGNVASISCLESGTDETADAAFQALQPTFSFLGKEEENKDGNTANGILGDGGNEGEGALDGVLDEVSGSFWGGNTGEFTFTDPGLGGAYAILFKFGQPSTSESWFAIKVAAGLDPFNIIWTALDADTNEQFSGGELSHVTLYAAPIPLPAGGILLITALGGLGIAAARRRRNKAA